MTLDWKYTTLAYSENTQTYSENTQTYSAWVIWIWKSLPGFYLLIVLKIPLWSQMLNIYIQYNDILNKKVKLFSKYKAFNLTSTFLITNGTCQLPHFSTQSVHQSFHISALKDHCLIIANMLILAFLQFYFSHTDPVIFTNVATTLFLVCFCSLYSQLNVFWSFSLQYVFSYI